MKKVKKMLISLMTFAITISLVIPQKSYAADSTIRLATFNIAANKNPDIEKMNALLDDNHIDVVGLQEVDVNTNRNNYDMLAKFVEQGTYTYHLFQKAIETGGGEYGVGLLSKYELTNTAGGSLNSEGIKEARAYQKAEIEVNGKTVSVYNTHLTYESIDARAKQLLELKSIMDSDTNEYKVLFGDFNTDQSHDEINPFLDNYNIANGKDGKWYDTFNGTDSTMKTNAVDNIITTRNIQVDNITMVETSLSDHNLFYLDATLLDEEVVSRDLLNKVIKQANALDEDLYSEASYHVLDEKLVVGETLSENATQQEVNQAVQDIQDAMDQLQAKYPNLALHKDVTVSGLEVTDGRFTADKAVDGEVSSTSRVSFAKDKDEQWMVVDLGEKKTISRFVLNYESCPPAFKIQVSTDGTNYTDVYSASGLEDGGPTVIKEIEIDPTEARYVKYIQLQRWKHTNGKYYSGSLYEFEVYERNPYTKNYANLALNKDVKVSGLEVTDGRFTADKAVDGEVSSTSRVSFAKDKDEQWLLVDLGSRKTVSHFVLNYESCPPAFKIQLSTDGVNYYDVYSESDLDDNGPTIVKEIDIEPTKARYVKYVQLQRWKHTNGKYYSGSIYEFEVYKEVDRTLTTAADVLKALNDEAPTIVDNQLILPEVPEGFEISLYGCDNKQVVAMDGTIYQPLQDMGVNVLYQVKNLNDEEDIAYSEADIHFIVSGQYSADESINAKPNVMPGLREWKGNEGEFTLTDHSKIVVKDSSLNDTAKQIQYYLKEMIHQDLQIVTSGETAGDIVLMKDSNLAILGEEGYTLDIDDIITIRSHHETGILYGGISITQILTQDEGMDNVPKGLVRDYPKYEVRSGMLDVARTYIPMEYLKEMTIYMAYFKLNEVRVHINDYWGATGYSAFRLECETYPMITATDGSYSKDEYRQYQIDMKQYGIDVITEIDTPYHAECFRSVPGVTMLKAGALDIREESSYEIIENVLDEYLDGDNPVIQSQKFHIGTDEYDKAYSEDMRKWTDHFIKYVNEKGYDTRVWASLGSKGFNGTTPVTNDATVNLWAPYWADVKETYAAGYDIINTCGGWLYIVPGANAGYPDRLDIASLYDKFDVNNFAPNRQLGVGTAIMPMAHPQTKGAEFALWNDMTSYGGGFSWFDIYDRFKDAVMIVSEKTWYGEKTSGQTSEQFIERVNALSDVVPGANPGRVVESQSEVITSIDFEETVDQKAKDTSGNNYHAELVNVKLEKNNGSQVATVSGDGYIALPYASVGYPYTVMMDVNIASDTPANTEIFSGEDGILYANIDGTGQLGYARGNYKFTFNYELPTDQWVNLALTCDQKNTTLYINGKTISIGNNMGTAINNRKDSNTFVLPVEKILNYAKGSIDNLSIYNEVLTEQEIADQLGIITLENIALNKEATASSCYPDRSWTADKAVDGGKDGDSRWSSKRATGTGNNDDNGQYGTVEQSLTVDLGKNYTIDKVYIKWESAYATKYTIQGSLDGETFFDIEDVTNGAGGEETFNQLNTEVRYVRIAMHEAKNANWGYSIYELEVYQSANQELKDVLDFVKDIFDDVESGTTNGCIVKDQYQKYAELIESADQLVAQDEISEIEFSAMIKKLNQAMDTIENDIIFEKDTALDLYNQMNQYQEKDYTKDSFVGFKDNLEVMKDLIDNANDYKEVRQVMSQLKDLDDSLVILQRDNLKNLIDEYENEQENDYTTSSWDNMQEILKEAKDVYDNPSLNQSEIDEAVKLFENIDLKKRGSTTLLEKLLDQYSEDNYTPSSWSKFSKTYQEAQAMIDDNSDITQAQVNLMMVKIVEEAKGLVLSADKENLDKEIVAVENTIKDLDVHLYTEESWTNLQAALQNAKDALDDENLSDADAEKLIEELQTALQELVKKTDEDQPVQPEPEDPENPTDPVQPVQPEPSVPSEPEDPKQPTDPVDPDITIQPNPSQPTIETPNSDTNMPSPIETGDTAMVELFALFSLLGLAGMVCLKKRRE